jgi:hypothetical protein
MTAKVYYTIVTTLPKAFLTYSISVVNAFLTPLLKITTISPLRRRLTITTSSLPAATVIMSTTAFGNLPVRSAGYYLT